ncbi:MAG: sigma 54-interacting transcriptional regulator, partial [Candidatus Tectomicrobia bacterium]|nr:sigma 54-interacting transcriptional regulator [Candidatus Tectomicrobia bacterium]
MAQRELLSLSHPTDRMVGQSPMIRALRLQIRHLASFDTIGNLSVPPVLIYGETGTGKGLVARVIHESGPRAQGPFIQVNCAAIPESLLEAELFGFEAGAFTDAKRPKPGLFETASGGTLFFDEIDALPLSLQGKLLQAIEERRVRRLGSVADQQVDVKLIAATQAQLSRYLTMGRFRSDLYFRLAVVLVEIPPLRARQEDILLLADHFLHRYAEAHRLPPKRLTQAAERWLKEYSWPGNVRELDHLMERAILFSTGTVLDQATLEQLCLPLSSPHPDTETVRDDQELLDEVAQITQALIQTEGNIVRAARLLGLSRSALRHRMARYGIGRPPKEERPRPLPVRGSVPFQSKESRDRLAHKDRPPLALLPNWEQKPVVVLAVELTFPQAMGLGASHYEPWTVSTQWEQVIVEKIQGFGGVLVQRSPSLLTAVFGIPQTLEQMPQRAVQTALAIRQLISEAKASAERELSPSVRLAVHSGAVLVDSHASDPAKRLLAVGETLSFPVRLLWHTSPGDILMSLQAGRLVEGTFEMEVRKLPIGGGQRNWITVSRVRGVRDQSATRAGLGEHAQSQFRGRERELSVLQDLLVRAEEGKGQVVGVVGEPGVGKSRILWEFVQRLTAQSVTHLEGRCVAYGSDVPYLPILDLIRQHCRITDADDSGAIIERVYQCLQAVGMTPDEGAPYLLQFLGTKAGTDRLAKLTPETIKMRTYETLRQLMLKSSQQQPLIIAIEDLHWIDHTSEEYLASLVETLPGAPILVICTYRPGYHPRWLEKSYATQITLPPLSRLDSLGLVRSVTQGKPLPDAVAQEIVVKAEGNPFFLEELTHTVMEQGDLNSTAALPDTIQRVLMARIDRLQTETKRLLQTASILGRDVPFHLLEAIWKGSDGPELHLKELKRLEFLYEQIGDGESCYLFKHALTQGVVYESLPPPRRQALHAAAGRALETLYAERLEEIYDRLAYHYSKTDEATKAVEYLAHFAEQAARRYAHIEAVTALREALIHGERLPEGERDRRCLELTLQLTRSLSDLGRFHESLDLLRQQQERLERIQDSWLTGRYYRLLSISYFFLGDYQLTVQHAQRALEEAAQCHDNVTMGLAYAALARTSYWSGYPSQGIEYGRQAVALLEGTEEWDSQGDAFRVLGLSYYFIGEFELALEAMIQANTILVQSTINLFTLGFIYATRGDWQE